MQCTVRSCACTCGWWWRQVRPLGGARCDGSFFLAVQVKVLSFDRVEGDDVIWKLANVRANRPDGKGRAISKKKLAADVAIPLSSITSAKIHIDM
jgi:hypothetical protein